MSRYQLSHVLAQIVVDEFDGEGNKVGSHLLGEKPVPLYHPHGLAVLELVRRQMQELSAQEDQKEGE
jgi:hypothetical protein